ncbi:MAG TPA: alpha/beta hydrolase [Candidatus Sulfotelmatobacter sp.]|nr:alpha/beta hydrolase [Candidatus Sulfotelmatobacter sp.]
MTGENEVKIPAGKATINGNLAIALKAKGIVLFAHGSGSGRFSPRNMKVARKINSAGIGTFLIDLLTEEEEAIDMYSAEFRFNIDLLAERLVFATDYLKKNQQTQNLKIGYFGASTGAAAALIAAAKHPDWIEAVVSRGGRPDLAGEYLPKVKTPTLLIVGGDDVEVLELNKEAFSKLSTEKKLTVVPGATHLFEEPGKLEEVAKLAISWFSKYLS